MKQVNLLKDPVKKVYLNYLVPSVSATLVTSIYILADTMMIGHGIGAAGIGALNILLPLYSMYYGIGMMCGIGGSVLFGFSRGQGKESEAREYFTTGLFMVLAAAVLSVILGTLLFHPLTSLLGSTDSIVEYMVPYGRVLVWASPMFMLSSFLQAFVRNDGAPRLAMAGVISGGITNVVLDYVFIFLLGWGMGGAALATATGTTLTILILSAHFFSKENHLKLERAVSLKKMSDIVGNGLSSFVLEMSNGLVMFLFNRQLLRYVGDIGVVVYGIISNAALVVTSLSNGMSQAVQPLLSSNFGAGNTDRIREARRLGIRVALLAGVLFTAAGLLFPVQLAYLFLDPTEEILSMAVPAVRLYFLGFLASQWNIMCGTYFQSIVKPKLSLAVTLMRGVLLNSVLVFVLPLILGVDGIWVTVTVSEFLTAGMVVVFMKKEDRN